MSKITDKTIKSMYPPKVTNVTWIDTSAKPAVTKIFINGKWTIVGGGGGTTDYDNLDHKPSINGVELEGDKSFAELTDGLLFGGEITTQTVVTPDTSCYYIVNGAGTYEAFGVTVYGDEHVQILVYNGTAWTVEQLKVYNYNYAHGKFDTLDDIDSMLDSIVPSSASSSNKLLTENERHFKGWHASVAELADQGDAEPGDAAYVKDASPATTWSIYTYDGSASETGYWADSGTDADTSNVQTFASGEEVNEVHIVNDLTTGGEDDVLSAKQGLVIREATEKPVAIVNDRFEYNDMMIGQLPTATNKYINSSGVETSFSNINYFTIPLLGNSSYIYFRCDTLGFCAATNIINFANEDGFIEACNTIVQTTYGVWQIGKIPSNATKIYLNLNKNYEDKIKLCTRFPYPYEDKNAVFNTDVEIFNKNIDVVSRYIQSDGTIISNGNIRATIPYPVIEGEIIRVLGYSTQSIEPSSITLKVQLFDSNMAYVDNLNFTTDPYSITIPTGIAYVSFLLITAAIDTLSIKRLAISEYSPKILPNAYLKELNNWDGQIWVGLGDSLTAQSGYTGLSWSPYVERATGLVFKNCGIGSTSLGGDLSNAFWKRLDAVEAYNPNVITILGGANDLYNDVPIGTDAEFEKAIADKDCTTFIGAYSYIIETLLTWKRSVRLVLMTPSYAHTNGADHTPGIGLTYQDYADATIRVAEYYCLPVIDLYRNMGINKLTQGSTYTNGDKIHWNAAASQIAASLVISKLKEINNAV